MSLMWRNREVTLPVHCPETWERDRFLNEIEQIFTRFQNKQKEILWDQLHRSLLPLEPLKVRCVQDSQSLKVELLFEHFPDQIAFKKWREEHSALKEIPLITEENPPYFEMDLSSPIETTHKRLRLLLKVLEDRPKTDSFRGSVPDGLLRVLTEKGEIDWLLFRSQLFPSIRVEKAEYNEAWPRSTVSLHFSSKEELDLFQVVNQRSPFFPMKMATRPQQIEGLSLKYEIIQKPHELKASIKNIFGIDC